MKCRITIATQEKRLTVDLPDHEEAERRFLELVQILLDRTREQQNQAVWEEVAEHPVEGAEMSEDPEPDKEEQNREKVPGGERRKQLYIPRDDVHQVPGLRRDPGDLLPVLQKPLRLQGLRRKATLPGASALCEGHLPSVRKGVEVPYKHPHADVFHALLGVPGIDAAVLEPGRGPLPERVAGKPQKEEKFKKGRTDLKMSTREHVKVGDIFWLVVEHLYTTQDGLFVKKEYRVTSGTVSKLLSRWDEMVLTGPGPDGYNLMHYYKLKDIGKQIFRTRKEAALYARELTEKNDRVWADIMGEEPMRRTWEKHLEEE